MKKLWEFYLSHSFLFSSLAAFVFTSVLTVFSYVYPEDISELFSLENLCLIIVISGLLIIPLLTLKNIFLTFIRPKTENVKKGIKRFNILSTVLGVFYCIILVFLYLGLEEDFIDTYSCDIPCIAQTVVFLLSLVTCAIQNYMLGLNKNEQPDTVPFTVLSIITVILIAAFIICNTMEEMFWPTIIIVLPANILLINLRKYLNKRREANQ